MSILKRERRWEQIFDIDGSLWEVREARATKHGFDILYGFPANSHLSAGGGPSRLIATPALVAYWEAYRTQEGAIYDLPAGRTTIKRMRTRLRMNFVKDRRNLWKKRAADLQTLPTNEFADRYNVTKGIAHCWRHLILGRTARPLDWWQHPEALAVLRTPGITLREIGESLNIGTSQAFRLRERAFKVDPTVLQQPIAGPIPKVRFERRPTNPPENPFLYSRKQGEMFVGQEFWRPRSPSPDVAEPSDVPTPEPSVAPTAPKRRPKRKHSHSKNTARTLGQMLLPFSATRGPDPHPVLFQVQDHQGTFYDVFDVRATNHGFDLLFGFPTKMHRRIFTQFGKPGLIATPELVAFWEAHRTEERINFDLPAGQTTLIRARQKLGFNQKADYQASWNERLSDLQTMPIVEFAKKYDVTIGCAKKHRKSLLDRISTPVLCEPKLAA